VNFTSRNPFAIWSFQLKVVGKIQRGVGMNIFWVIFKYSFLILPVSFDWSLEIENRLLEVKYRFISQLSLA